MMCHLCASEKQKLKASDAALSPWLTSLSTFTAQVFKRYDVDPVGVLQYIANELKVQDFFGRKRDLNLSIIGWQQF